MNNVVEILNSLPVGLINPMYKIIKEDYLKDHQSSEDSIMRFLEKCDEYDLIDIFSKVKDTPHVELRLNFYNVIRYFPAKLIGYLYQENKIMHNKDFPLTLFSHYIDLNSDEKRKIKDIYEMFNKKGHYNLNDKQSYLYKSLIKEKSIFTILKIEKKLNVNLSHLFLEIESGINNEVGMFCYIDNWSDVDNVHDYKINDRTLIERIIDAGKVNMINYSSIMLIIDYKLADFSILSEDNIKFASQMTEHVLECMQDVHNCKDFENLINYEKVMKEKQKIEKSLASPENNSICKKRL